MGPLVRKNHSCNLFHGAKNAARINKVQLLASNGLPSLLWSIFYDIMREYKAYKYIEPIKLLTADVCIVGKNKSHEVLHEVEVKNNPVNRFLDWELDVNAYDL